MKAKKQKRCDGKRETKKQQDKVKLCESNYWDWDVDELVILAYVVVCIQFICLNARQRQDSMIENAGLHKKLGNT